MVTRSPLGLLSYAILPSFPLRSRHKRHDWIVYSWCSLVLHRQMGWYNSCHERKNSCSNVRICSKVEPNNSDHGQTVNAITWQARQFIANDAIESGGQWYFHHNRHILANQTICWPPNPDAIVQLGIVFFFGSSACSPAAAWNNKSSGICQSPSTDSRQNGHRMAGFEIEWLQFDAN